MPTTVELQDGTELEFPDGMDEMAMRQAISKSFPQFAKPLPSESAAVLPPGESTPGAFGRGPMTALPQAFPAQGQQMADATAQEDARVQMMEQRAAEARPAPGVESVEFTPRQIEPIKLPNVGEPGTFTGEASRVVTGLGEWALNKPEEILLAMTPWGGAALAARYGPVVAKQLVEDTPLAIKGDQGAQGRIFGVLATVAAPVAAKGGARAISRAVDETAMQRSEARAVDQAARESVQPLTQEAPTLLKRADAELQAIQTGTDPKTVQTVSAPDRGEMRQIRKQQAPVIPETPPEGQRGISVLEEIRQAGADTTAKVQKLYPHLKREEAAALRRQAFQAERTDAIPKREAAQVPLEEPPRGSPQVVEEVRQQAGGDDAGTKAPPTPTGRDVGTPTGITAEAAAMIQKGEKDFPQYITRNMERIARENGVEITSSMTPRDVFDALKRKAEDAPAPKTTLPPEEQVAARADLARELGDEPPLSEPIGGKEVPKTAEPTVASSGLFTPEALATPASRTAGLKPASSDPMAIVHQVKDFWQKNFTVRGHLPEEVMGLKRELEQTRAATDNAVKMGERDLMAALKEVYNLSEIEVAGGGSRRIPSDAVRLMDAYLKGRVANPTVIPPKIRGVLDTMRAEIDGQSQKVIGMLDAQRAALPPSSPQFKSLTDLIDKIRNNLDVYVHRSYKFFDSENPAPQWYADLNVGIRQRAEDYVINNSPVPLSRAEAQSKLLDWLSDLKPTGADKGSATLGSKDLSIFMRRNVIAPEIRAVLGEYNNPLINYAKSVTKMADWVAKQKFLNEVRRQGMGKFLFEEGMNPPGFNAKIAAEGSQTLSPLNGLRTTQEIADAFKQIDATTDYGAIARAYLTVNAWSKFAATGLSVMTQERNLLSRPFMAGMAGHWQGAKMGTAVRAIFEDFAGKDPAWRSYLKEAYELGVIGDTARAGELKAIIKDAALRDVSPAELYSWSMMRAIKKYGYKIPAEIYRLSDEVGNLFGWENEKAIQRKIHPTWTDQQVKTEAAKIVRDLYPTYSETPKAIQQLRKVVVFGPFITFPYQMIRTTWNGMSRSLHEIRSTNPVEREVGYKRLASQLTTVTAAYALQEAAKAMLGISTQQEDDFRRFQPPWSRNSKFLFLGKDQEKGELNAINLSYLDPYSYITDPLIAIASNARSDKPMFELFAETSKEMLRPWISEQMLAKSLIEARNGKTDTGREIFNPTDSPMEKFGKQLDHVLTVLKPGTLQRFERRILPAIRDEQPVYGRKLEVGPEIARELSGVAIEKFNFKNGLAFRAREFVDKDKASEGIFHDTLSRTQTTTPDDLLNAYKKSDERRFLAWQEIRKDFLATVRQGISVADARRLLVARGVSAMDAAAIAAGRYVPMPISQQAMRRSIERKRQIPIPGIAAYQAEARQRSLD